MRLLALAGLLGVFASTVVAQPMVNPQGDGVTWRCWYSEEHGPALACRLVRSPPQVPRASMSPVVPPILRQIRNEPESLHDDVIVIPLYGPPVEISWVARLARAVMCGARVACHVDFSSATKD